MEGINAINEVKELIAGKLQNLSGDESFIGIETDVEQIHGGELFIDCSGDTADIAEAIDKGVVAVITKESPDLPANGNYILIEDTHLSLTRLAKWWRTKFACPIIAVCHPSENVLTSLMARLFLKSGRGAYTAPNSDDPQANLKAVFKLHAQCEWGICMVMQQEDVDLWQPTIAVAKTEGELIPGCEKNFCIQNDTINVLDKEHNILQQFKIEDSRSDYIFGCSFILAEGEEKNKIDSTMVGSWRITTIALALAVAKSLFPNVSNDAFITTIRRFSVLPGELNLRLTCKGRVIYDGSLLNDASGDEKFFQLASEVKGKQQYVFVITERPDRTDKFLIKITELLPKEVVIVGEYKEAQSKLKEAGVQVIMAQTAQAALHTLTKLDTECIMISGGQVLRSILDGLLDLEGETVPDRN